MELKANLEVKEDSVEIVDNNIKTGNLEKYFKPNCRTQETFFVSQRKKGGPRHSITPILIVSIFYY